MKVYLKNYIKEIDELLEKNKKISDEEIEKHLIKISFFQHERLIHLFVTLFYGLLSIVFLALGCFAHYIFFAIAFIVLVFLMFYVAHYFLLENGVQYLYKQYDIMLEKNKTSILKLWK